MSQSEYLREKQRKTKKTFGPAKLGDESMRIMVHRFKSSTVQKHSPAKQCCRPYPNGVGYRQASFDTVVSASAGCELCEEGPPRYKQSITVCDTDVPDYTIVQQQGESIMLDNSGGDGFIAKYKPDGTVLWATRIAGSGNDSGYSIATDASSNVLVTGYYTSPLTIYNADGSGGATLDNSGGNDCFIAKYSSSGSVLWATRIAGSGIEYGSSIGTDAASNVLVTGYYTSPLTIYNADGSGGATLDNSGGNDCFIAKYSSSGTVLWATRIAGAGSDIGNSIATDASSNVLVTGYYTSPLTIYNADGSGGATLDISGSFDCFIAKYSSSGTVLWATRIAGSGGDTGYGIATDAASNVLVTGYYNSPLTIYNADGSGGATLDISGSFDCFIAKYSSSGTVLWATRIAGSGIDNGYSIATDAASNVLVTGYYDSPLTIYNASGISYKTLANPGSEDCFIAKYSSSGTVLWATRIAGGGEEYGKSIATDAASNVLVTGYYESPLTIYSSIVEKKVYKPVSKPAALMGKMTCCDKPPYVPRKPEPNCCMKPGNVNTFKANNIPATPVAPAEGACCNT